MWSIWQNARWASISWKSHKSIQDPAFLLYPIPLCQLTIPRSTLLHGNPLTSPQPGNQMGCLPSPSCSPLPVQSHPQPCSSLLGTPQILLADLAFLFPMDVFSHPLLTDSHIFLSGTISKSTFYPVSPVATPIRVSKAHPTRKLTPTTLS